MFILKNYQCSGLAYGLDEAQIGLGVLGIGEGAGKAGTGRDFGTGDGVGAAAEAAHSGVGVIATGRIGQRPAHREVAFSDRHRFARIHDRED